MLMIAAMIMPTATRTIAAWAHLRSSDIVRLLARVLVTRVIFPSSLAFRFMRSATGGIGPASALVGSCPPIRCRLCGSCR